LSSISKLWKKFGNPEYRKAFVASQINIGIPFQIRALAKSRGWNQTELAARADMAQPRISSLMKPGGGPPNLRTLTRLAEAFDCALMVRFVPFSELARWSNSFDPENFQATAFDSDKLTVPGLVYSADTASLSPSTGNMRGTETATVYPMPARKSVTAEFSSHPKEATTDAA
jgi:transcriptional regulator with XRE-family HTH domain